MPTPDYSKDPAFQKAVADGVAAQLAARDKKAKPPGNYDELEERLADRTADKVIEKLGLLDDEGKTDEDGDMGILGNILGFGKKKAAQ